MRRRERPAPRGVRGGRAPGAAVLLAGLGAAVLAPACGDSGVQAARAHRIAGRNETIGGPAALAEVGDVVIENGVIRAAILATGNSVGPGMFGGSLVDVDLVRRDGRHPPGRGEDQFSELFPMVNLVIPGYVDDPSSRMQFRDLTVEILDTAATSWCASEGFRPGCAAVRVTGKGDRIVEALGTIATLSVPMNLSFDSVFVLEPGADFLRIRTDAYVDNRYVEGNPPLELGTVAGVVEDGLGVMDVLVGDDLLPPAEQVWAPGFLAGDFLMFGKKVKVFSGGSGYDLENVFQRLFDAGRDILGDPVAADAIVGVGEGVSYAYASVSGPTIVPIFTGAFTGVFTHVLRCRRDDAACMGLQQSPMRYERVLAVGRGDVASAMAPLYELRRRAGGAAPGTFAGHVYDATTGRPVPGAQVFLVEDPGGEFPATADRLLQRNREARGDPGVVTELGTDLLGDDTPDGSFSGPVPAGTYFVVVRVPARGLSAPARVRIGAGATTEATLASGLPGRVRYEVFDDAGVRSPAKLTFVGPLIDGEGCGPGAAQPDLTSQSAARPLPLGGGEMPGRIASYVFTTDGEGEVEIEPGRYDLWISRGIEFSVDRQCVTVPANRTERVVGTVLREVDTTGYVSADFHIHGINSYDAETSHALRLASSLAEGVELVTPSDHDYVTDFGPTARAMGIEHLITTAVATEVTPIEIGHFIAFPLRYDELEPEHGAIDWTRRDECLGRTGDPDWPECNYDGTPGFVLPLAPQEIFDRLRALGSLGPDRTVTIVAHPRDGFFGYFDQFGLNHYDDSLLSPGLVRGQHPLLAEAERYFTWDFDAIELFNAKRFELIRTPTAREITGFANDLTGARERGAPESEIARLHDRYGREVLARTVAEQRALRLGRAPECLDATRCDPGEMCDMQRRACVPQGTTCRTDGDCPAGEICSSEQRPFACVAACESDDDCRVDSYCDLAHSALGRCATRSCSATEDPDVPCSQNGTPASEGVIDDWFRLLNYGVIKAGLGNSDTHSLSSVETGSPRNFIASATDDAGRIDVGGIADAMRPVFDDGGSLVRGPRVIATYGPFVELFVDGRPIGSVVTPSGSEVTVAVRVQWPSWFDVDRVEIYRNGELLPGTITVPVPSPSPQIYYDFTDDLGTLPLRPDGSRVDAWYVAIAMGTGEGARSMSPVYTANRHPNLGFSQVVAVTFAAIDVPLLHLVVPPPLPLPEQIPVIPYGITNPVFVDADGNPGFQSPLGPPPTDWEPGEGGTPLLSPVERVEPAFDPGWDERARIRRFRTALERGLGCGGDR